MDENQNIILAAPDIVQSTHSTLIREKPTTEGKDTAGWTNLSGVTGNLNLVSELGTIGDTLVLESCVDKSGMDNDIYENFKDKDGNFSTINSEEIPGIPNLETSHLNEAVSRNKNRNNFVNVDEEKTSNDRKCLNHSELQHCMEHAGDSKSKFGEEMNVSLTETRQSKDVIAQTCDNVREKRCKFVHRKRIQDKRHTTIRLEIQKNVCYDRDRLKLLTRDKLWKPNSFTNLSENSIGNRNSNNRSRSDKPKIKTCPRRRKSEFVLPSSKRGSKSKSRPPGLVTSALDKNVENVDVFGNLLVGSVQDPEVMPTRDFPACRVEVPDSTKCRQFPKYWVDSEIYTLSDFEGFYGRLLCAERVTQMTRAYNDIEAVNRLLEEKERDLELAARIGQTLLQKNQDLTDKNESLEEQVSQATEKLNQFRHEILRKDELLQALTHSESDSTPTEDSPNGNTEGLYALGASSLQKKVKSLEQENVKLRIETVQLSAETSDFEEKEQKLVSDCLEQLGEVKDQIAVYSQELAQKTEETYLQKEEITNLLAQLVDLQRKCKVLTAENLELQKHLEASQSAQKHLTKELAEYKDKHDEVLELLEENQEELRRLRRQHKPNVAKHSYLSTSLLSIPNDSIASELESSLKSEIDYPVGYSPAERKVHNWRIFETAKAAKKASNKHNGISNSNSFGTEKTSGISGMSCMSGLSTLSLNDSLDSGAHSPRMSGAHSPRMSGAASSVGRPSTASAGMSNRSSMYFSECESVQSDGYTADLDSLYGDVKKHSLGRPGIPGSNDLETALRKLSIRRANELNEEDFFEDEEKRKRQRHRSDTSRSDAQESTDTTGMCQTPDSTLSTGSFRSGFSQLSYPGSNNPHYRLPEKLKIIKPLEGSVTLRHWQQLATPHLGGIFESRPGVQIKGERKLDMDEEVYNLSDFEEDDDYEDNTECYKRFQESSTINTYTNSMVKHPTQLVGEDGSELDSDIDCVESTSTKLSTPRLSSMVQSSGTTTYSMSLGLAAILNERDFLSPTDNKPQTSGSKQSRSGCLVSESHFDLEKSKAQALTVTSSSGASVSLTTSSPTKMSAEKPNSLSGVDYQEANILSRIKNTGFSLYGYLGKLGQRSDSVVSLPTHLHDNTKVSQEGAIPKVSVCSVPTQSSSVDNLVTIASATEGGSEASKSTSTSAIFGSGASGGGVLGALTSIRKSGIF